MALSENDAKLELALFNSRAAKFDLIDIKTDLTNEGLPYEVIGRIEELLDKTKIIAGEVIYVGKIIFMKIWEFIKQYPATVFGVTTGALLGAIVGALVGWIPILGQFLHGLIIALGMIAGAILGNKFDPIAKDFFKMFVDTFTSLKDHFA